MSIRSYLEVLNQRILAGIILVGRLCVVFETTTAATDGVDPWLTKGGREGDAYPAQESQRPSLTYSQFWTRLWIWIPISYRSELSWTIWQQSISLWPWTTQPVWAIESSSTSDYNLSQRATGTTSPWTKRRTAWQKIAICWGTPF